MCSVFVLFKKSTGFLSSNYSLWSLVPYISLVCLLDKTMLHYATSNWVYVLPMSTIFKRHPYSSCHAKRDFDNFVGMVSMECEIPLLLVFPLFNQQFSQLIGSCKLNVIRLTLVSCKFSHGYSYNIVCK